MNASLIAIVTVFGFNDRTWLDHDGHPHTEALRMTERYRRRDFGNLELEVTFSDPAAYARPWTVAVRAELAADTEILEFACNESGHGVEHWVGRASDEKKNEVQVALEILATYVGIYEEQPPLWRAVPRVVEITLLNGRLLADMDGRGKVPLIATSETAFPVCTGSGLNSSRTAPADSLSSMSRAITGSHGSRVREHTCYRAAVDGAGRDARSFFMTTSPFITNLTRSIPTRVTALSPVTPGARAAACRRSRAQPDRRS